MKKIFALMLALALCLGMVGCGTEEKAPEILGTYETTLDMRDIMVAGFDNSAGEYGVSLDDYMGSAEMILISRFNEDGTYSQELERESVEEVKAETERAFGELMDDLLLAVVIDALAQQGVELSTAEEVEAYVGRSLESAFVDYIGMDKETYISATMDQLFSVDAFVEAAYVEGKYKAEGGKLHMSFSLNDDYRNDAYENYSIDGNVVTVVSGVNVEEMDYMRYPYELVKVE